jgi:hypothetical protein
VVVSLRRKILQNKAIQSQWYLFINESLTDIIKNLINDIKDITTHHNIQPQPNKPDNMDAAACPTCGQGVILLWVVLVSKIGL